MDTPRPFHILFISRLFFIFLFLHALNTSAQISKELESPRKQIIYFDLPSQALKNGLIEFAIQSKITIIVESSLVDGFRSKPIVGPHIPENALKLLLSKAPLTFKVLEESQSILIQSSPKTVNAIKIPTIPEQETDSPVQEVIVQGVAFPFRYNTVSNSQVYGNSSNFSTARFISVLPQTLVTDQAPDELADLLRMSSGITPSDGLADTNDDFYIRGFPRYGVYQDGFRLSSDTGIKLSSANIEQVEVLKGPSTLFYGQAEPGGIVNVVRKKPQASTHHKLGLTLGSSGEQRLYTDSTGAIPKSQKSLMYRFIASEKKQDTFRDVRDIERGLIAPSLTWTLSDKTIIDLSYEKQYSKQTREQGTVILAPLREGVDIVSVNKEAHQASPNFKANQHLTTLGLQHYFSPSWSFKGSWHQSKENRDGIRGERDALYTSDLLLNKDDLSAEPPLEDTVLVSDGLVFRGSEIDKEGQWLPVAVIHSLYAEVTKERGKALSANLNGDYLLGRTHNDLTIGLDWSKRSLYEKYILEQRNDIQSISLATDDRGGIQEALHAIFNESPELGALNIKQQSINYKDYGLFALNSTQINDDWRLSLGGRYTVTSGSQQGTNNLVKSKLKTYEAFSSELGLLYQPSEAAGFYFNYSEGFKANYQVDDVDTELNKPELSKQLELGLKTLLMSDRLATTLALFDIEKTHVVNIQFIEGLRTASLQGRQLSKGLDLDFTYQVSDSLDILGAFSLIDPKIDAGENKGNTPELASKKVASLFLNYSFHDGAAKGLIFNIGAYYLGQRYGNNDNNPESIINSFYTLDLGTAYTFGSSSRRYRFQLGIKNALDEDYILATEGRIRSNHGSGRRLTASLNFEFF